MRHVTGRGLLPVNDLATETPAEVRHGEKFEIVAKAISHCHSHQAPNRTGNLNTSFSHSIGSKIKNLFPKNLIHFIE